MNKTAPLFKKNGTCLKTKNGFCVNFHGTVFFVNKSFVYQPWTLTIRHGKLPPTNEYGRLRNLGLVERSLTDTEEKQCLATANILRNNPLFKVPQKAAPEKKKAAIIKNIANNFSGNFATAAGFEKLKNLKFG